MRTREAPNPEGTARTIYISQLIVGSLWGRHVPGLDDWRSDPIIHTRTPGHPINLILGKHQTRVLLVFELISSLYPPSPSGFEPRLSIWKARFLALYRRLPSRLIRIAELRLFGSCPSQCPTASKGLQDSSRIVYILFARIFFVVEI